MKAGFNLGALTKEIKMTGWLLITRAEIGGETKRLRNRIETIVWMIFTISAQT